MKSLFAIGTWAALAALSSGAQAQPREQTAASADPGAGFGPQQLTTFKVRDNFYMIRSGGSGNCSVLVAEDGVVLIDDKFAMDHDAIMAKLREITDKPVLYVINTHLHADHSGGNAAKQASARRSSHTRTRASRWRKLRIPASPTLRSKSTCAFTTESSCSTCTGLGAATRTATSSFTYPSKR